MSWSTIMWFLGRSDGIGTTSDYSGHRELTVVQNRQFRFGLVCVEPPVPAGGTVPRNAIKDFCSHIRQNVGAAV